jgi:hypothetical protein
VLKSGAKTSQISQIASVVRSPEKAGVGGSTPSLATIIPKQLRRIGKFPSVRSQSAIFSRSMRAAAK